MAALSTRAKGPPSGGVRLLHLLSLAAPLLAARYTPITGCPKYGGQECAGRGVCTQQSGGVACVCAEGYMHADCSTANFCLKNCSGVGSCIPPSRHTQQAAPLTPGTCACEPGFSGPYCETVDGASNPAPAGCEDWCSGQGKCEPNEDASAGMCRCYATFEGEDCTEVSKSSSSSGGSLSGGAIAGYVFLSIGIVFLLVVGVLLYRRYTKRLSYYEKILADLPAGDSRGQHLMASGNRPPIVALDADQVPMPHESHPALGLSFDNPMVPRGGGGEGGAAADVRAPAVAAPAVQLDMHDQGDDQQGVSADL